MRQNGDIRSIQYLTIYISFSHDAPPFPPSPPPHAAGAATPAPAPCAAGGSAATATAAAADPNAEIIKIFGCPGVFCGNRELNPITSLALTNVAGVTPSLTLETCQFTPSLHGGVVSEPE